MPELLLRADCMYMALEGVQDSTRAALAVPLACRFGAAPAVVLHHSSRATLYPLLQHSPNTALLPEPGSRNGRRLLMAAMTMMMTRSMITKGEV
jgi:hypothetical protein